MSTIVRWSAVVEEVIQTKLDVTLLVTSEYIEL